jgi:hypothetical protein
VDTSTHHLSAFGHHVTIGTSFPIYEGGEEGLLPSVNILRFHHSTLASTIQTTFTKVSTDLIPAAPLWLRNMALIRNLAKLSTTALIADVFILAGLVYIFGSEFGIIVQRGIAKVQLFNPTDFPLPIRYATLSSVS